MVESVATNEIIGKPKFEVGISTTREEARYIRNELLDKSKHYIEAGFRPVLPSARLIEAFNKGESLGDNEIQQLLVPQEARGERFRLGYERTGEALDAMGGALTACMQEAQEEFGFRVFPNYVLRLYESGPWGDYYPSWSTFLPEVLRVGPGINTQSTGETLPAIPATILITAERDGNFGPYTVEHLIVHETVHTGIEEMVRALGLTHKEKEDWVHNLCLNGFSTAYPAYKAYYQTQLPDYLENTELPMLDRIKRYKQDNG